jgi:hypothetical protein
MIPRTPSTVSLGAGLQGLAGALTVSVLWTWKMVTLSGQLR